MKKMKFQSRHIILLLGVLLLSLAACSGGAQTTNQTSSTSAPASTAASTQATNAQPSATAVVQSAQPTSAQPTQAPPTEAPTAAATAAATKNAPPASGANALDLIANAMQAQLSAKSFRSTIVTSEGGQTTATTVIEYVAPDRVHLTRTLPGAQGSETIVIKGQGTWEKTNGKWIKSPVDLSAVAFAFLDPKVIDQLKSSVNVGTLQLVGPDLIGTTPTFVYQYDESVKGIGAGGGDLNGTYKVWVGATDHRVYKLEGDSDSPAKAGAKIHTLATYEYDINIQIQPPI
jgi:hypothetical protein